jgi:hypothetical protein
MSAATRIACFAARAAKTRNQHRSQCSLRHADCRSVHKKSSGAPRRRYKNSIEIARLLAAALPGDERRGGSAIRLWQPLHNLGIARRIVTPREAGRRGGWRMCSPLRDADDRKAERLRRWGNPRPRRPAAAESRKVPPPVDRSGASPLPLFMPRLCRGIVPRLEKIWPQRYISCAIALSSHRE